MRIAIIGTGYVGLTTGTALAYLNHEVIGVDTDHEKISMLKRRKSPIHEYGLEQLLNESRTCISFTSSIREAVADAEVILIAVGTPSRANGEADTSYVEAAAAEAARWLRPGRFYTMVVKSTVPIGTNQRVALLVRSALKEYSIDADVAFASNPEFLREGLALRDTLYPDRIVIGSNCPRALGVLRQVYRPILDQTFAPPAFLPRPEGYNHPALVETDIVSAEMIKYAANTFLAVKISLINEIAGLCERIGADVTQVAHGVGLDRRIGYRFLQAGIGWGGSCFPKDTAALLATAREYGYTMPITAAAREVNHRQRHVVVDKLQRELKVLRGRVIGVLGLAFKPNTDDVRESPALDIVRMLINLGAQVRVHDPIAIPNAKRAMSDVANVKYCTDPYIVSEQADALVLATDWEEYRQLDLGKLARGMKVPILVDGRNFIDSKAAKSAGFLYFGVGK